MDGDGRVGASAMRGEGGEDGAGWEGAGIGARRGGLDHGWAGRRRSYRSCCGILADGVLDIGPYLMGKLRRVTYMMPMPARAISM